jgi:hypothetical protein
VHREKQSVEETNKGGDREGDPERSSDSRERTAGYIKETGETTQRERGRQSGRHREGKTWDKGEEGQVGSDQVRLGRVRSGQFGLG